MREVEERYPSTAEDGGPPPHKWGGEGSAYFTSHSLVVREKRGPMVFLRPIYGEGDHEVVEGCLAYLSRAFRGLCVILLASLQLAAAVAPHEAMGNAAQDRRARTLYTEVRCVVCQNESIADSSADIAADLRADIRARIIEGKSDTQIREALVDRYGDFILFRPRFTMANLILWASPFLVLILGGLAFFHLTRRSKAVPSETVSVDLDAEEAERLRERLEKVAPSGKTSSPMIGQNDSLDRS